MSVTVNQFLLSSHLCFHLRIVLVAERNSMNSHYLRLWSCTKLNLLTVTSFTCYEAVNNVSIDNFRMPMLNNSVKPFWSMYVFNPWRYHIFAKEKDCEISITDGYTEH